MVEAIISPPWVLRFTTEAGAFFDGESDRGSSRLLVTGHLKGRLRPTSNLKAWVVEDEVIIAIPNAQLLTISTAPSPIKP